MYLSRQYNTAVLVVNQVSDVINKQTTGRPGRQPMCLHVFKYHGCGAAPFLAARAPGLIADPIPTTAFTVVNEIRKLTRKQ